MITRNNYEIHFIDYLENNLSEQETVELQLFLQQNPDLDDELKTFSTIKLEAQPVKIDKTHLKRIIDNLPMSAENADEHIISLIENDYTPKNKEKLLLWINSTPELIAKYNTYQHTKLTPDKTVTFANKHKLYKSKKQYLLSTLTIALSVAATALLFYTLFHSIQSETPAKTIAEKTTQPIIPTDNNIILDTNQKIQNTRDTTVLKPSKKEIRTVRKAKIYTAENKKRTVKIEQTLQHTQTLTRMEPVYYYFETGKSNYTIALSTKIVPDTYVITTEENERYNTEEYENYNLKNTEEHVVQGFDHFITKEKLIKLAGKAINLINRKSNNIKIEVEFDEQNNIQLFALHSPIFTVELKNDFK